MTARQGNEAVRTPVELQRFDMFSTVCRYLVLIASGIAGSWTVLLRQQFPRFGFLPAAHPVSVRMP